MQSFDPDQLLGKKRTVSQINDGNCKPVTSSGGKAYYPCGLIANSYYNDTYNGGKVTLLNPSNGASNETYQFSEKNIAWHGIAKNYVDRPWGNITDYLPPPNWHEKYPNGYTEDNFPDLAADEHFHVWMRVAALPTFRKLWARNDDDVMKSGTYEAVAMMSESTAAVFGNVKLMPRLPRQAVRRHQVDPDLDCRVGRRQAAVPRLGVRRRRDPLRRARHCGPHPPLHQAEKARRHEP